MTGKPQALPSSRVAPVRTCPDLRPRWCPSLLAVTQEKTAAFRYVQCVGVSSPRSGRYPVGHNVQISGLNSAACTFATPGFIHPVTGMHAGSLRTCWLGFGPVGLAFLAAHRLGNISEFQCLLSSSPRFGFSLARVHRRSAWQLQNLISSVYP